MTKIKVASDFSGVGAFNQALIRLGIDFKEVFACDMDKYARQTFAHNYLTELDVIMEKVGMLGNLANGDWCGDFYFPRNVYDREIPADPLDIYMTSPPCQAFSLAGKRKGEDDKRGVLFYNSHEFIKINNPRYFIFENVKGLLSDDSGKTFQRWIDMLAGKTVNGNPVIFPHEESVPYHVYYQVMNAKHYGVPQNRERIFIIGIRDDADNNFSFPKPYPLVKRLKDVLEPEVDEKYFLSDLCVGKLLRSNANADILDKDIPEHSSTIIAGYYKLPRDVQYLKVKSATSQGYEMATENDSINFSVPNSETRRGRVGKGVAQILDTACNQAVIMYDKRRGAEVVIKNGDAFCYGKSEDFGVTFSTGFANTVDCKAKQGVNINSAIRRLTPRECFRLMDFNEDFIERTLNSKKYLYFQFVYSKFDINKKETLCNAKLKVVKDTQTPKNLETYVLCTTKECQKMDALTTLKQRREIKTENNENPLNVNFAIEVLGELERKECVTNTIKWTDCTETLYMLMKEGKNQVVKDISEIQKDKSYIEKSLKITLEENLSEEKLFIILILLKQIMTSKIYTYVKMPLNTQRFISSTVVYEKKSERLLLSYLKMEYTEQVVSDSMLYKQAGNSIVVNCLVEIIKKLNL